MNFGIGNLVRGVIYDDIDTSAIKNEMFESMHYDGVHTVNNYFANSMYEETNHNISTEDATLYLTNMTAVAALTGYDEDTDKTSNLIIPKNSVSKSLLTELEKVDLGKNLVAEYADNFFINYIGATRKEEMKISTSCCNDDICNHESSALPQELINAINNGAKIRFIVPEDMTKEEFESSFSNFISELEKAVTKIA